MNGARRRREKEWVEDGSTDLPQGFALQKFDQTLAGDLVMVLRHQPWDARSKTTDAATSTANRVKLNNICLMDRSKRLMRNRTDMS